MVFVVLLPELTRSITISHTTYRPKKKSCSPTLNGKGDVYSITKKKALGYYATCFMHKLNVNQYGYICTLRFNKVRSTYDVSPSIFFNKYKKMRDRHTTWQKK